MQRVGLPDHLENLISDVEFGLAEEGAFLGGHECPGDGEELLAGVLFHLGGELLGLGFLFGGQGRRRSTWGILPGEWFRDHHSELRRSIQKFHQLWSCLPAGRGETVCCYPEGPGSGILYSPYHAPRTVPPDHPCGGSSATIAHHWRPSADLAP